jgi:hypothetical protein
MSDSCDPAHYIAARELDETLKKLRTDLATKDAELKACKGPDKKPGGGDKSFHWVAAVVMAVGFFCLLQHCSGH